MDKKEIIFAEGIYFDKPGEKSPDFIKGKINIDLERLYTWGKAHVNGKGYVRLDLKKSREGKLYLSLNTWEPMQPKPDFSQGEVTPDTLTSAGYNGEPAIDLENVPF